MSDGAADRRRPGPLPIRSGRGRAEADHDHSAGASPQDSERPASVREAMQRGRRYAARPARQARTSRRRPPHPRGRAPAPARELVDAPVAKVPSREVEVGNETWNVLLRGSSTVGSGDAPGARLLSVGLEAPRGRPSPEGTHYLVAQDLADVDESVLRGLVRKAIGGDPDGVRAPARPAGQPRGRGRFRRRGR